MSFSCALVGVGTHGRRSLHREQRARNERRKERRIRSFVNYICRTTQDTWLKADTKFEVIEIEHVGGAQQVHMGDNWYAVCELAMPVSPTHGGNCLCRFTRPELTYKRQERKCEQFALKEEKKTHDVLSLSVGHFSARVSNYPTEACRSGVRHEKMHNGPLRSSEAELFSEIKT